MDGSIESRASADFMATAKQQSAKGIKKYGHPIDPTDINYDWYHMAMAELVDGARYLTALQSRLESLEDENEELKRRLAKYESQ